MKVADVIRRAGRSLRQAKVRTLLTSLAIGVGAFTITLALAAGEGGRGFTGEIVSANTDVREVLVSKPQPTATEGPRKYDETAGGMAGESAGGVGLGSYEMLRESDISEIRDMKHVEAVFPSYSPTVQYIVGRNNERYQVDSIQIFSPGVSLEYKAGSASDSIGDDEVIIPESYAKALGYDNYDDAVGEAVTIRAAQLASAPIAPETRDFEFTIKGVTGADGFAFRSQESLLLSEDSVVDIYNYVMEGMPSKGRYMLAAVRIDDANNADTVKEALIENGYEAQTSADVLGAINTFINVLMAVLIGFGALAVITSIFGIINTQYISVLERTQQIGLMKALGARRKDIGRLFRFEAAWIGFLGGLIGSGLAVLAGTIANPIISDQLDLGDTYLLIFNPLAPLGVIAGLMIVAMLAGYFPARKAAKLDPIEALRTE